MITDKEYYAKINKIYNDVNLSSEQKNTLINQVKILKNNNQIKQIQQAKINNKLDNNTNINLDNKQQNIQKRSYTSADEIIDTPTLDNPIDNIFLEVIRTKVNLVKEIFEDLIIDLGDTLNVIDYHNYMIENPLKIGSMSNLGGGIFGDFSNASMGNITVDKLMKIFPNGKPELIGATIWALQNYGSKIGLTSRGMLFVLAQMGHESAGFTTFAEYGKGSGKAYGKPAGPYGKKYYGRGPLQVTWESNYKKINDEYFPRLGITGVDIYSNPDLLETNPGIGAAASMCWFMGGNNGKNAVKYANAGDVNNLTRMINGGYNGLQDRINKTNQILAIS